jgi:hypothetical protein
MSTMEKSATAGLVALALSDFLACAAHLPQAIIDYTITSWKSLSFKLIYLVYGSHVASIFMVSSLWLTVFMAVSRFIGICHPFRARYIVDMKFAVGSMAGVFIGSVLLNLPRFWHYKIVCFNTTLSNQSTPELVWGGGPRQPASRLDRMACLHDRLLHSWPLDSRCDPHLL